MMCCSLIKCGESQARRWAYIFNKWRQLTGHSPSLSFSNETYLSLRTPANREFCLGYMMQERGAFQHGCDKKEEPRAWSSKDMEKNLELYFQECSIEMNVEDMATVAATLANGGVCPTTGTRVFKAEYVRNCLSLMLSCGMGDFSGEWSFKIGMPAKSGTSGVVMMVVPNIGGFAIFSPRLNEEGNSVRASNFFDRLSRMYNLHFLEVAPSNHQDSKAKFYRDTSSKVIYNDKLVTLCFECAAGNLLAVRGLVASGADIAAADYDGRTPLHLASSAGQLEVVKFIVNKSVEINPVDRWGGTPLSDARRGGHTEVAKFLEENGAVLSQEFDDD